MDTKGWLDKLFNSIDSMDAEQFGTFLSDDVVFKYGNLPPVTGKKETVVFVGNFFGSIGGLSHTISEFWLVDDAVICRGMVTYTRKDSSKLTVPFTDIFISSNGQIKEYAIYIDVSELYKPAEVNG